MKFPTFKCLFSTLALFLAAGTGFGQPHLADYDAELRLPDRRVDTDLMIKRLHDLGTTTYCWLIVHTATDWDDLKLFLPKAAKARIQVWVYLVSPTESAPREGTLYPEPLRLDYRRWAEEKPGFSAG